MQMDTVTGAPVRFPSSIAVIIPAWQPDQELLHLVRSLEQRGCSVVIVVDDGSGYAYRPVLDQVRSVSGVRLLHHAQNLGKGSALKTGMRCFLSDFPEYSGVVTADADGQHAPEDIERVASTLEQEHNLLVLGIRSRDFLAPLRSRFGNSLTRHVFRAVTGMAVADTQTGLRGFPRALLPEMLDISGDRYEYEMAVLLTYCNSGRALIHVPIRTIYNDGNRSSHFHPIRDSIHIYKVMARHWLSRR